MTDETIPSPISALRRLRAPATALASILALASITGGCGQKGDLYLPEPEPAAADTAPTADAPVSEKGEDEDDDADDETDAGEASDAQGTEPPEPAGP